MRWSTPAAAAGLVVLALLSAWWLSTALRAPERVDADRGPAWYFGDASVTATGRGGNLLYRIEAPLITHDPTDESALLERPRLEWLQGAGPPLLIEAALGRIHADRRSVSLSGGVTIIDESTGIRFEFRAPDLAIDAESRVARTAADVEIRSAHGLMTGTGLVADMNDGTIRIESRVRGRYAR